MAIASQRVPISALPTVDSSSFFNNLVGNVGGAIDNVVAGNLVAKTLRNQQAAQAQPAIPNAVNPTPATTQVLNANPSAPASVGAVATGTPNDIQNQFITTAQNGIDLGGGQKIALTNPYGLAALAATGKAETSWSPASVNASWPDPSASGKAGTSGGILSWRNERLANLRNYAASQGEDPSNISPATQAKFFLQEDPTLITKLNAAQSPQEAANLMAKAWAFRGYDQPGGEAARRQALTQNYYATQFANAQSQPVQVASNNPSVGIPAQGQQQAQAIVPQSQGDFDPATITPSQMQTALGPAPQQTPQAQPGYVDPTVTTAGRQPTVASAAATQVIAPRPQQAPGVIAGAVTPLNRQNVDPDLIRRLVQNPETRAFGLGMAQQVLGNKPNDSWDFVKLDDGTLARANKQTGAVETLGNFQASKKGYISLGRGTALNTETGQIVSAPAGTTGIQKFGLAPVYGTDADGNTVIGQVAQDGTFHQVDTGGFKPVGNVTNTNLGTTIQTRDKAGNVISNTPIDNAGKEAAITQGKNLATNQQAFPAVEAASNQLLATIDSLAQDPYLDKTLGPFNSRLPNVSPESERVQSKKDQITGQTFLQAYNTLRGGGAITDIEGKKATESLSRLNSAQSPQDYRDALNEFRGIVVNALARSRTQAGAAPTANTTSTGVQWSIEK